METLTTEKKRLISDIKLINSKKLKIIIELKACSFSFLEPGTLRQ